MKFVFEANELPEKIKALNDLEELASRINTVLSTSFDDWDMVLAKFKELYIVENGKVLVEISDVNRTDAAVQKWNNGIQQLREVVTEAKRVAKNIKVTFSIKEEAI